MSPPGGEGAKFSFPSSLLYMLLMLFWEVVGGCNQSKHTEERRIGFRSEAQIIISVDAWQVK